MWSCAGRRRRRLLAGLFVLLLAAVAIRRFNLTNVIPMRFWGRVLGLQAKHSQFLLEEKPFRILGGSMHYFRIPQEYWRDRLVKMKACGLNTLTTYVPWNLHEAVRGKFDFSGNLDLQAFLRIAEEVGLWVILRPGPYICSEWDLGGLPSWLLQDPEMQLRTTYKGFTEAVDSYFDNLMLQVVHLQYKNGGPIIAMQVENEYGSYAQDQNYMAYIKQALLSRNVVELLVTSDNKDGLSAGTVEGALATINFQKMERELVSSLNKLQRDMPMLVMEYWTGWFDSWGGPHNVFDADEMLDRVEDVLRSGASINLYMFHGGTNFGFMNGALHFNDYKATITSYDYDAVLTEAGDYTAKYFKLRKLFSSMIETPLPPPPIISHKASYGAILMQQYISLWELLSGMEIVKSEYPINMENLPINNGNGQAFGYTLYETVILGGGTLYSRDYIRDRAQVFINTRYIGHLDYNVQELSIPNRQGYRQLQILVENSGRVNYGLNLNNQRKGLIGDIVFNKTSLRNFKIYSLEMKPSFMESLRGASPWSAIPDSAVGPAFFRGTLQVQYVPQDTFLKLEGWEKGVVFVNGQNLGRYWKIGPQETLYLPGTWLQQGYNEIIIFEERLGGRIIHSTDLAFLGRVQYVT
ncbi:beta-galactosidase-1-like protein 2 isoform X2 [Ahaetulla prasina]|uniref:beta-galactosidase-1-like protein 2 isoform X1 n=1 Tax=Ahaetulla prasina TaxID=499056 RepID=UPI00264820F1|nr:beta-galactosidase-1-like protein 2 isoform X1 [Ahaetulla prasina]XP_058049980.1 beta-galactosidase-1-like protein 2 isoform X2 [Ahaetulla prasina]